MSFCWSRTLTFDPNLKSSSHSSAVRRSPLTRRNSTHIMERMEYRATWLRGGGGLLIVVEWRHVWWWWSVHCGCWRAGLRVTANRRWLATSATVTKATRVSSPIRRSLGAGATETSAIHCLLQHSVCILLYNTLQSLVSRWYIAYWRYSVNHFKQQLSTR